ncbi:uncharacterized protein A4U43_C08F27220 [Asparagus officinalis]|nr:uncharacterized protein A4U43_C08F27220 [Asparagus officinalis]
MESTSSDDEESLRDNNVDLNDDNLEHHLTLDVSNHLAESDNIFSSHQQFSENPEPFVGMEFESEEAAKLFYMAYASRIGFSVRISKSRRSRNDESIIMRRFVCSKEGYHMKKENFDDGKKKRRRPTIREGCNAMIEVIQKYYGRWVVTKLVTEHNHIVAAPSRVRYIAPEEYADMEPFLGMEFPSHEAAQTFYYAYASRIGFDVRIRLSRRSTRDESFVMRRFVCTKEGYAPLEENSDESKKKRNRTPTREGCKAMFEVMKKDYDRWIVSKLVMEHTHDLAIAPSKVHYIQSQTEVVVLAKSGTVNREKPVALANSGPQHVYLCSQKVYGWRYKEMLCVELLMNPFSVFCQPPNRGYHYGCPSGPVRAVQKALPGPEPRPDQFWAEHWAGLRMATGLGWAVTHTEPAYSGSGLIGRLAYELDMDLFLKPMSELKPGSQT